MAIFFGLILVLFAILAVTIDRKYVLISMHDTFEGFMAVDPGFSSPRNLSDPGTGDFEQSLVQKILALVKAVPSIIQYKVMDGQEPEPYERMDVDIKFIDYKDILDDRERAIKVGLLSDPSSVKAIIRFRGDTYKAKIRLKGDLPSHWTSRYRMSFRVNLKKGKTILGFKKFSLQKPRERQHPYDQTFQELIRKVGNLSPIHKYVHLYVNGSDWGIMDMEEHVSKVLLEKLQRKESAILRFGNEKSWLYKRKVGHRYPWYRISDPHLNVHFYGAGKYFENPLYRKWFTYISEERMKEHRDHLYDVESFSKAIILARAWNNEHTLGYANSRYYLNPYTLRLEPITTDQDSYKVLPDKLLRASHQVYELHMDVLRMDSYKENLERSINEVYPVVSQVQEVLDDYQKMFPLDKRKAGDVVVSNMEKIVANPEKYLLIRGAKLEEEGVKIPLPTEEEANGFDEHIFVRHYEDGRLQLFNLIPDAVQVKRILLNGNPVIQEGFSLPGYVPGAYENITLDTEIKGIHDDQIRVETEYKGRVRESRNGYTLLIKGVHNPLRFETADDLEFLEKLPGNNWKIPEGTWWIKTPIVVNGNLRIMPRTRLKFSENAYLIVKGDLTAESFRNSPIVFEPVAETWKGVYVLEGKGKSRLRNVVFGKTSGLSDGLLNLTGGITFYRVHLDMKNVAFNGTSAEDALNLVKSSFKLKNVFVGGARSDGIDFDFSTGTILASKFENIGGDALDFSGSTIDIHQVSASKIRDKAISVGEASHINIYKSHLFDIGVGVASKDGSVAKAEQVTISRYKLHAAMTYLKKNFFDQPSLELLNCKVDEGDAFSRQEGTRMLVDHVEVEEISTDVKALYKGEVMKK